MLFFFLNRALILSVQELDFSSLILRGNCCGKDLPEQQDILDAPLSDGCLGDLPDLHDKLEAHTDISSIGGAGRTKIGDGLSSTIPYSIDPSSYKDDALESLDFLENEDFPELARDACEREDFLDEFEATLALSLLLPLRLLPTLMELLILICRPSKLGVD